MFVVWVMIRVKPEHVAAFVAAALDTHRHTRLEPGNLRFALLRLNDDPTRFRLYEVYHSEADFRAHQQTAHYLRWRDAVNPLMAEQRSAEKCTNLAPEPWS